MRVLSWFSIASILATVSGQNIRGILNGVALRRGAEFSNPNSYQSRALRFVENTIGSGRSNLDYTVYYALACIFYASSGVRNKRTDQAFATLPTLPGWITSTGWVTNAPYCNWHGVICTNGRVTQLQLDNNRMFGTFAPEVQLLNPSLQILDLFSNFYLVTEGDAGNSWISRMTNLRKLYFGTTSFEYNGIPTFFNGLTNLVELDISNTFFTNGPIRDSAFRNLPNLEYLDIADNIYTSTIPNSISQLPDLQFLYVDNVQFAGVSQTLNFMLPMRKIFECWMDFTSFSGGIPAGFGNLVTLQSFSCTFCTLSGNIPPEIGNMRNLDRLWLYQNNLNGFIPNQLGNLARMKFLHLEGNDLRGSMPSQICARRSPNGLITELGADCAASDRRVTCSCCTCCGGTGCSNFVDGTPSPTVAPVGPVSAPIGFCFSGSTLVETPSGPKSLNDLEVGEMVSNGNGFEPVYTFGHYDPDTTTSYIQLTANGLDKPLELSKGHMIFLERGTIPASSVVLGDKVMTQEGAFAEVTMIKEVMAKGVFAPFTKSGKIVVNGVVASNFVTFRDGEEALTIGGVKTMNFHGLSHLFMAPHRLACALNSDICTKATFDKGINSVLVRPMNGALYMLEQNVVVQSVLFTTWFGISSMFAALEMLWAYLLPLSLVVSTAWILRKKKNVV